MLPHTQSRLRLSTRLTPFLVGDISIPRYMSRQAARARPVLGARPVTERGRNTCCVAFGRKKRRTGATGGNRAEWAVPYGLAERRPRHAHRTCLDACRNCARRGGDAARGAVFGLQVQPATGRGARNPAGHRRGGAARDIGLSAQHYRQRRYLLPAHHDQPRHHRQRRPQPARLPGGPGAAAVSRLPHGERGQLGGGHRAGRPRDAARWPSRACCWRR